ncbi:hypothetical protein [Rhodopseudomonas palustris]|uniref:hypothetical protein n=1 Tax=Rhodopseudomonas palustris TaxID=1076 RepID=UPI0005A2FB1D|nr:hypothetical protein [Rhodopseudomonas palustris]
MPRIIEHEQPPKQVFGLATPADVLLKLYWEIAQLKKALEPSDDYRIEGTAIYHAFNCGVTSWHISDWAWEALSKSYRQELVRSQGNDLSVDSQKALYKFQELIREKHRPLHICWQIATGSKHRNIRNPDPLIRVEEVWINQSVAGRMRAGQPLGWHTQELFVYDGGEREPALDVFERAANCWAEELRSWGFLEDRFISSSRDE